MLVRSLDDIWSAVCEECKENISEIAFDTFFKYITPERISSQEFVLTAANEYICGMIENVYTEIIANAIEKVMGFKIPPKFIVADDEETILRAEQESEGLTFEDFFTFDNFVVGSSNRFAHAAAIAVSNQPSQNYNPLVIYGPSGVGKTHLMLAIKNEIKRKHPKKRVEFVRGEEFTNQLIQALHEGKLGMGTIDDFRNKFRNVDVLLLDDIHFIAGKESTMEEFFNTFNTLYQNNAQIVVTLDRPIKDVKTLDERIRSRLMAGLSADIDSPDFETRVGIIRRKSVHFKVHLDENMVYYIAENIKSNTRQIEGVIKRIKLFVDVNKKSPTISVIQDFIKEIISETMPEPIKIERIITEVARTYNVSESDILSNRKTASLVLARQVAMYISRETTDLSYKAIGESFGKDHTTVLYNVKRIEDFLKDKPYEKELVEEIIKNLESGR